jgi:hypothetical protein
VEIVQELGAGLLDVGKGVKLGGEVGEVARFGEASEVGEVGEVSGSVQKNTKTYNP